MARGQRKTRVNIRFRWEKKKKLRVVHYIICFDIIDNERHGDVVSKKKKGARSAVRFESVRCCRPACTRNIIVCVHVTYPSALFDSNVYRQIVYTYPILKRKKIVINPFGPETHRRRRCGNELQTTNIHPPGKNVLPSSVHTLSTQIRVQSILIIIENNRVFSPTFPPPDHVTFHSGVALR
jgi:hypothetical protein